MQYQFNYNQNQYGQGEIYLNGFAHKPIDSTLPIESYEWVYAAKPYVASEEIILIDSTQYYHEWPASELPTWPTPEINTVSMIWIAVLILSIWRLRLHAKDRSNSRHKSRRDA